MSGEPKGPTEFALMLLSLANIDFLPMVVNPDIVPSQFFLLCPFHIHIEYVAKLAFKW